MTESSSQPFQWLWGEKNRWTSGFPKCRCMVILVDFIPFDLMFAMKISSSRMGLLPDPLSINESEVKPSGKNMGRPRWDCNEINARCNADELASQSWWGGSKPTKFWKNFIESLAECRAWLMILPSISMAGKNRWTSGFPKMPLAMADYW